ncbi:response regulator [Aquabacterium sp.]|uniref:response regulator n=1 Tax=Aquabacterium sp. TaxID=1872578 RepID=UPI002487031C|nr:response regulator [Aquabacterium sp.]MDI1260771.1 response regulator [Aquabacterium sp.]
MTTTFLIIEDNAANMELVRYLLTFSGYKVLLAHDGQQGLQMALNERPDLIICDLQMPRLDGYQVLEQLRSSSQGEQPIVIAVTAFSMPNDRQKSLTAGFNGYISKPIEPENFVSQLESFLPEQMRLPRPVPGH